MGQLAKQLAEKSTRNFVANIEKNLKEECKVVVTRSQGRERVEKREKPEVLTFAWLYRKRGIARKKS